MNKIKSVIDKQRKFAVFPIVCADHCAKLLNLEFDQVAKDGEKLAYVLEFGYQKYKYDMILVFCDAYVEAQALGCPVSLKPYPTLKGPRTNSACDRTPEIIKATQLLCEKEDVPVFVSIKGPFSLASFLVDMENFLKMLLLDETKAKRAIDEALHFQLEYLTKLLSIKANIFIGDPVASPSVISPECFAKFAFEPLKILIDRVKEGGVNSGVHICGDTSPIMAELDNLGADILSVEDITIPTETIKMGGVSTDTILSGDRLMIEEEVKEALTEPHVILSTSCDVPVDTAPKNIKTMISFANELSKN